MTENKMKMKCITCGKDYEPTSEDIKSISEMVDRNNLKSDAYLHKLADQGGLCKDEDVHLYEFDEKFDIEVHGIVKTVDKLQKEKEEIITESDLTCISINDLRNQLKTLMKQQIEQLNTLKQKDDEEEQQLIKLQELTLSRNVTPWN